MPRCYGCMNEYNIDTDLCPHCGYVRGTEPESRNHLLPGTMIAGRYQIGKALGQGGFGITYIAWDTRLQRKRAIKEYMPTALASRITGQTDVTCYNTESAKLFSDGIRHMLDESRRLAYFNELESVVKVFDCFEENKTAYIVMELLEGQNIKELLKQKTKLDYRQVISIMTPVLQALNEIHKTGLIHRDISPDNIVRCDNGKVKLLDFGSARAASGVDEKTLSVMLKPGFAPPEQYSSRSFQGQWTDMYSVAATLYKMLTGITPVDSLARSMNQDELEPISELEPDVPPVLAEAIMQGLEPNYKNRIQSADEFLDVFAQCDGKSVPTRPVKRPAPKKKKKNTKWWIPMTAAVLAVAIGVGVYHGLKGGGSPHIEPETEIQTEPIDGEGILDYNKMNIQDHKYFESAHKADTVIYEPDETGLGTRVSYFNAPSRQSMTEIWSPERELLSCIWTWKNSEGNVIQEATTDKNDIPISAVLYTYNKKGELVEAKYYDKENLDKTVTYKDGVEHTVTYADGSTGAYTFENGFILSFAKQDSSGQTLESISGTGTDAENYDLYYWDANNSMTKQETYENGHLVAASVYEDGLLQTTTTFTYENGSLTRVDVTDIEDHLLSAIGYTYKNGALETVRARDGKDSLTCLYDVTDKTTKEYTYAEDAEKNQWSTSEHRDGDGKVITRCVRTFEDGLLQSSETTDENGDVTERSVFEYNSIGGRCEETKFNSDGDVAFERLYAWDGGDELNLIREIEYYEETNEIHFLSMYDDDGNLEFRNSFNSSGNILSHKNYNPDGTLEYEKKVEYVNNKKVRVSTVNASDQIMSVLEFDSNERMTSLKLYEDATLTDSYVRRTTIIVDRVTHEHGGRSETIDFNESFWSQYDID